MRRAISSAGVQIHLGSGSFKLWLSATVFLGATGHASSPLESRERAENEDMGIFLAGINISARRTVTVRVEDVSDARDAEPMISEGIVVSTKTTTGTSS